MSVRQRSALIVLLLASTLSVMAGATVMPVLDLIRSDLGIDGTLAGFVITTHGVVIAVAGPVVGRLIDRYGVRRPLVAGLIVYGVGGGAGMAATDYPTLLASRVALGLGAAVVFTGTTVALLSLYRGSERDRVMGWRSTATTIGGLVWPLAAGALGGVSWHGAFAVYVVGVPLGIAALRCLPAGADGAAAPADGTAGGGVLRLLRRYPALLGWYALMLMMGLAMYSTAVFLPTRLAGIGVHSPLLVSLFMVASSLTAAVLGLLYARIRGRARHGVLLRVAFACWVAGFALLAVVDVYPLVLVAGAVFGIGNGLLLPTLTVLIGDTPAADDRGKATSLSGTAMFVGQFASPLVFGPLIEATSVTTGFAVAAVLSGVTLAVLVSVRVPEPHDDRIKAAA
ncbi:putative arabinose efflux permease, MFS family [Prauserella aidingensis]|uniref:MFS transporter n=1 Tax=Prauserella aidingensis TaxID=387890 RepID=UPI0020A55D8D|nr:MFS transporter [Prauserella aidingensis]MCP2253821.1 putative arabinose efflux permease, MFS family [Prauserella aidingensis]